VVTTPSFAKPYVTQTVGTAPNQVNVAFIGVTAQEVPTITIASATDGLCFKDPADSILHYYDTMKTAGADVIVVLSHLGFNDGGYGYGIPVYGDKTLAQKLIDAKMPVPLIIGGHSHSDFSPLDKPWVPGTGTPPLPALPPTYSVIGNTTAIVQAYYNGRRVGDADMTFDPGTKAVTVSWQNLVVDPKGTEDPKVKALIGTYVNDPAYLALVNKPIGFSAVDPPRNGGTVDNMMGTFVDDAI
jgi:5'-nucleotidase / UDP-sugar diphosphatase